MFKENGVLHLPGIISDHAPILINTHRTNKRKIKPSNEIEYYWMEHPEFQDIVANIWSSQDGDTMSKLEGVGKALHKWSIRSFSNIFQAVEDVKTELLNLQKEAHLRDTRTEEKILCDKIDSLNQLQYKYYDQRSKVQWIPNVDKNTHIFHLVATQRKRKNQITALQCTDGNWITQADEVVAHLVNHFYSLFKRDPQEHNNSIQFQAPVSLDATDNEVIASIPTSEEIWSVIKHMKNLKAVGTDGMPSIFFKRYWEYIGEGVTQTIKHCFSSTTLPSGLNHTNICLIPKVKHPTFPSEFRLIALTNIMYNVITKILAQRLKKHLNNLVDHAQSAFIPGRMIIDNIVASKEIFHTMSSSSSIIGAYALKIDISKAYDKVTGDF